MNNIDSLYYELGKYRRKFNIARLITFVLVFSPFIVGYIFKNIIWIFISVVILIIMVSFIGIPILKNINRLQKEIKVEEEALNNVKNF